MDDVDLTAIAKSSDQKSLNRLLEWILGAAVQCEDKGQFITEIMGMQEENQRHIMVIVQNIMMTSQVNFVIKPENYISL
jgi:hypothetical protein